MKFLLIKSLLRIALKLLVPSFSLLCRIRQTDTQTHRPNMVTLAAHVHQGLKLNT